MKYTCLLLLVLCLSGSASAYPGMQKPTSQPLATVDLISVLPQPYPIEAVPFQNQQGHQIDFSRYRGKVILVNMWATWCPPCVRELPAIQRFADKLKTQDFVVLPISIDVKGAEQVTPFLKGLGLEQFTSYYDPSQQLGQVFPLDTIPATFILNREGQLVAFVRTYVDWDDDKAVTLIQQLLQKTTP